MQVQQSPPAPDAALYDGRDPAIAAIARNSPNDAVRCQTASRDPYRYCAPYGERGGSSNTVPPQASSKGGN